MPNGIAPVVPVECLLARRGHDTEAIVGRIFSQNELKERGSLSTSFGFTAFAPQTDHGFQMKGLGEEFGEGDVFDSVP